MDRRDLAAKARSLPAEPGVYTFFDASGDVLYIGKARSLRDRVSSYFGAGQAPRIAAMVEQAADVQVVLVATDQEAYLLESSLVRERRPRYNVMLTDDKSYPYIFLSAEAHPRIAIVRDQDEKGTYYGPFPDAGSARALVNLVRESLGVRDCTKELPKGCIKHDIGMCSAPCFRDIEPAYLASVDEARRVLAGDARPAVAILARRMAEASEAMEYERAARLRDRIARIHEMLQRQSIFATGREDKDAISFACSAERSVAVVVPQRGGRVIDAQTFVLPGAEPADLPQLASEFIARFYEARHELPHEVLVSAEPQDANALGAALSARAGRRVSLRVPERGSGARLLKLAQRNAEFQLGRVERARGADPGVADLAQRLDLGKLPRTLDCIDVSHHGGHGVVASVVTFVDGRPDKRGYRTYKLSREANDDFAAMSEVVTRRLRRLTEEGRDLPDVLLVDGGQGQVGSAKAAADALGLPVTILGLAKREELVWRPGWNAPIRLPRDAPGRLMLQRARDEAHRFAITYGRKRRERDLTTSVLDAVPGVGPTLRARLLRRFGSVDGIRKASLDELVTVKGVGRELGKRIQATVGRA